MRLGIATACLLDFVPLGYELPDFDAYELNPGDHYRDFAIPLARAVVAGTVKRASPSAVPQCARPHFLQ